MPPSEGGRFAEAYADATTVWLLLIWGGLGSRVAAEARGGAAGSR